MKKCIICNSPNITKSFNKNQFVYFKCTDCQVLFVDLEMAAEDVFANYSEDYYEADAIGVEDRMGYPSYRGAQDTLGVSFSDKLALVKQYVSSGRLLDAGAAYGLFLKAASSDFEGIGIDVSEYAASVARNEFGVNVSAGDIEHTNFPDEHFDAIVLWDIIEHLMHPVEALKEVQRILKPGGYVFISTDDAANWLPRLLGSHWWALAAPLHLCHFSKKGMSVAFKQAGMKIEGFSSDPRRYSLAEIIKHFGVSYQSTFLTNFGTWIGKNVLGQFVFNVTRPEQFVAIGRKPKGTL